MVRAICKGPLTVAKESPPLKPRSPGPNAIQSAVNARALTIRAAINTRVLTTLRGSASSTPKRANVIPIGNAANSPAANLSALGQS